MSMKTAAKRRRRKAPQNLPATPPPPSARGVWVGSLLASVVLLALGYWVLRDPNATATPANRTSAVNGQQADLLMQEMAAAYQNLNSYADRTQMEFRVRDGDGWLKESAELALTYERPQRLRLVAKRPAAGISISFVTNGEEMVASIVDPTTADFDGQVVQRSAPRRLTVASLYSGTEYADLSRPNELFSLLMTLPAQLQLSPLAFLLEKDALAIFLSSARAMKQLPDQRVDGRDCHIVELRTDAGRFVFWIDREDRLLRRIEFPTGAEKGDEEAALVCSYTAIETNVPRNPREYQLTIPPTAHRVRNFVLPPAETPAKVLNQRPGGFYLTTLDGNQLPSQQWAGKITLLCWFDRQPASQATLAAIEPAYRRRAKDERFEFLAVCSEPVDRLRNQELLALAATWQTKLPLARDLAARGHDLFGIQVTPTIVILDAEGRVQLFEEGCGPDFDEQLPIVLEKLLAGENLAQEYLEFVERRQNDYQNYLAMASIDAPAPQSSLPTVAVSAASEPQKVRLVSLWHNPSLQLVGNLLPIASGVNASGATQVQILAIRDGSELLQLGGDGQIEAHYVLADGGQPINKLRTVVDGSGRRYFAGWSNLSTNFSLFDDNWNRIFRYPPDELRSDEENAEKFSSAGIQAVHLADLAGDGQPEAYVAFSGELGLHQVDLTGKRNWKNEKVTGAVSLTSSVDRSGNAYLLASSENGQILPVGGDGKLQRAINVGSRAVHQLFSSDPNDARSVFCATSYLPTGGLLALGLNGRLEEEWSYPLPSGVHANEIDSVSCGEFPSGRPLWLLAGADGSIHMVAADGEFYDHFNYGKELTGLATYRTVAGLVVLISSRDGVEAMRVEE